MEVLSYPFLMNDSLEERSQNSCCYLAVAVEQKYLMQNILESSPPSVTAVDQKGASPGLEGQ